MVAGNVSGKMSLKGKSVIWRRRRRVGLKSLHGHLNLDFFVRLAS